jgi:hypothetical protein
MPQHAIMVWRSVKAQGYLYLYLYLTCKHLVTDHLYVSVCIMGSFFSCTFTKFLRTGTTVSDLMTSIFRVSVYHRYHGFGSWSASVTSAKSFLPSFGQHLTRSNLQFSFLTLCFFTCIFCYRIDLQSSILCSYPIPSLRLCTIILNPMSAMRKRIFCRLQRIDHSLKSEMQIHINATAVHGFNVLFLGFPW